MKMRLRCSWVSGIRLSPTLAVLVVVRTSCAASLRPIVVPVPGPAGETGEPRTVAVGQPLTSGAAIEQGCYIYVAVRDYLTPSAGASETAWIVQGQEFRACYEDPEDKDALFLTDVHPTRSGVWLRIRRDGFVGDGDGWWSYHSTEGPDDYRAIRLFQGAWNRSRWTSERLMAPAVAEVMYEGREGDEIRLGHRVRAPSGGVPFEQRYSRTFDLGVSDVVSAWNHTFRVLSADEDSISFVIANDFGPLVPSVGDR